VARHRYKLFFAFSIRCGSCPKKAGCRVVQLALKSATRNLQEALAHELHGHVRDAVDSPHANFVLQLIVELMPVTSTTFVANELTGIAAQVSQHRYGCRVIIRLLEHSATEPTTVALVNELVAEAHILVRHSMARFVIQAVLEHGLPDQRRRIVTALHGAHGTNDDILWNAMNRNASCVFESAMMHCCLEDKQAICKELLSNSSSVLQLAQHQFGRFTLRALLTCPGEETEAALRFLQSSNELRESRAGRRMLDLMSQREFAD